MAIFEQERFRFPGASSPTGLRAEAEAYAASLGQVRGTPGWGDAVRGYVRNLAGRGSARKGAPPPPPRRRFAEDDPKPPSDFWSFLQQAPLVPKGPPGRRTPGDLHKRFFANRPRPDDSAAMENRLEEGIARLPAERRQLLASDKVELSASPSLDRFYSTMLVKEDGIRRDGSFKISPRGAVGPGQLLPGTAHDVAGRLGIPFDTWRLHHDRVYNEMLGQAYYKELVSQFGGDVVKAAAAYNAGPAAATHAIEAARKAGKARDWESHLPRETRNYVEFFKKFNHLPSD